MLITSNLFLPRLAACVFGLLLMGAGHRASAQSAAKDLEVADCVKVIRPDSLHLFFDSGYALTPAACATIRRESRMDAATGGFLGEVRDYLVVNNTLMNTMHYASGQREGGYERYHANKQLAVRGQFTHGNPSGTWQEWYSDGRPHQILEWTGKAQPSLRIIAYWDARGRQQVTNGTGTWEGTSEGSFPLRYGGRVTGGYQQGTWKSYSQQKGALQAIEEFQDGSMLKGQAYVGDIAKPMKYKSPTMEPQLTDASLKAEPLHLGMSCEQQAAWAAAAAASKAEVAGMVIVAPRPPRDASAYQEKMLRQLISFNNLTQWMPRADGQTTLITANIDAQGKLSNFDSESGVLSTAFASILADMGAWYPATVNGQAVPGKLRITLRMYSTQLQSALQANVAYPLPPDIFQKPAR